MTFFAAVSSFAILCLPAGTKSEIGSKEVLHGDRPPAVTVGKWLKGTPVTKFTNGKVYVVQFWDLPTGGNEKSFKALAAVTKRYPSQVVVVSVASYEWENSDYLTDYVRELGDKMPFSVAMDDAHNTTTNAWTLYCRCYDYPRTFIIDKTGVVAWIGISNDVEKHIGSIVAGKHDVNANRAAYFKRYPDNKELSSGTRTGVVSVRRQPLPRPSIQ